MAGNPINWIDSLGLEYIERCTREFHPISLPYVKHCFIKTTSETGVQMTMSHDNKGVHPDPNPDGSSTQCKVADKNGDYNCYRQAMLECSNRGYKFFLNNCCDCTYYAINKCKGNTNIPWPNIPFNSNAKWKQ